MTRKPVDNKIIHRKIKLVIQKMIDFQKREHVFEMCVLNSKCVYDLFRLWFDIKINIIVGFIIDTNFPRNTIACHVWLEFDNIQYEPSYEYAHVDNDCRYLNEIDLPKDKINNNIMEILLFDYKQHNETKKSILEQPKNITYDSTILNHKIYYDKLKYLIDEKIFY